MPGSMAIILFNYGGDSRLRGNDLGFHVNDLGFPGNDLGFHVNDRVVLN